MFVYENLEFCITVVVVVFYVTARFRANQTLTANLWVKVWKEPTQKTNIEYNLCDRHKKSEPEMQVLTLI